MITPQKKHAEAHSVETSPQDRLAFAVHSFFLASGYRTIAVGKKALETIECPESLPEADIEGWNDLTDSYAFQYADEEGKRSSLKVIALKADNKLLVSCMALGASPGEPTNLDLDIPEFSHTGSTSTSSTAGTGGQSGFENFDKLTEALNKAFGAVGEAPEKAPEEKSSQPEPATQQTSTLEVPASRPRYTPYGPNPGDPDYNIPSYPVGARDLYPPPILGVGPGPLGYLPPGGLPGRGGGMLVGPDDPLFGGHPGLRPPGSRHPAGGRWDPIAPPGMQGFRPGDFQTGHRQPHPDIMPPGPGPRGGPDFDHMFG